MPRPRSAKTNDPAHDQGPAATSAAHDGSGIGPGGGEIGPGSSDSVEEEPTQSQDPQESGEGFEDLSFRQARTALDLTLAQLQSSDLEVETMAALYRRALRYADRCEAILRQVEQEVMQWDPQDPSRDPQPLDP
jgi:exodeoxyribonuclease VII small subunit